MSVAQEAALVLPALACWGNSKEADDSTHMRNWGLLPGSGSESLAVLKGTAPVAAQGSARIKGWKYSPWKTNYSPTPSRTPRSSDLEITTSLSFRITNSGAF